MSYESMYIHDLDSRLEISLRSVIIIKNVVIIFT